MISIVFLLLCLLFMNHSTASTVFALERHIHAGAGGSSPQELPLLVARDLGIFQKYGLDVDVVVIGGGLRLMQALIGRSVDSANVAAMAPVRANLSGANAVITGAFLNKNLYKFVTRKDIRKPSDLRGRSLAGEFRRSQRVQHSDGIKSLEHPGGRGENSACG
jgi:ABC-type nitrate/sulfonate/bicarbonate transport system substrate-binding protein